MTSDGNNLNGFEEKQSGGRPHTKVPAGFSPLRCETIWGRKANRSALVYGVLFFALAAVNVTLLAKAWSAQAHHCTTMMGAGSHGRLSAGAVKSRPTAYPWLGVLVTDSSKNSMEGARVTNVFPNSPAESIGLSVGNIITHVGNHPIAGARTLVKVVRSHELGASVPVEWVDRAGSRHSATANLESIDGSTLRQHRSRGMRDLLE